MPKAIPIQEEYETPIGKFENYDAFDTQQRFALAQQEHIDIRTFESRELRASVTMVHLNMLPMETLNQQTMSQLMDTIIIRRPEPWDHGTIGPQSDRNNWQGLTLACGVGTTVATSVITN